MSSSRHLIALLLLASAATLGAAVPPQMNAFIEKWCIDCHDGGSKKGGLDFEALDFSTDEAAHAKWVRTLDRVLAGEMPPPKKAQPDAATKRAFLTVLGGGLMQQHTAMKGVVLRRLNRTEYENTLRDLFGVRLEVRDLLPEDSLAHGFDNIGSALAMSDVQLRRYLEAAEVAVNAALVGDEKPESQTKSFSYADTRSGKSAIGKSWHQTADGAVVFFNSGGFPSTQLDTFRAPADGTYRIRITGYAYQSDAPIAFALHTGSFRGGDADLQGWFELKPGAPNTVEVEAWLRAGESLQLSANVKPNQPKLQKEGPAAYDGKGLAVQKVEAIGPEVAQWPPRGRTLLFGDLPMKAGAGGGQQRRFGRAAQSFEATSSQPDADATRLLRGFASAAFRRPASDAKVAPYVALFRDEMKSGSSFTEAMRTAAIAILCAPDFLYLVEPAGKLDDYALAARLSYFLTRTAPDDELLKLAAAGQLRQPATLRAQTERLLAGPRAARFTADFTDAWLDLRNIDFTMPDKQLYPEFDGMLRDSMVRETRAYFDELLKNNLSVMQVVQSDFAMLNARLAQHYGIDGVSGLAMQRVKLPPGSRRDGGFLTQASILKVSANGANTSPVIRGVFVNDRILGTPPLAPPPGTPGVEPDVRGAKTLREILEKHRDMESCNSCHRVIDPPGFALESYDVIGGWRDNFRSLGEGKPVPKIDGQFVRYKIGLPVDASGHLANGTSFKDFAEFQKLLVGSPLQVTKTMTEKLLTFASGREMGFSDRNEINRIAQEVATKRAGLRDLLHRVVQSEIFLSQ